MSECFQINLEILNNARVNNLGNNETEIAYSDTPDSSSDDDCVFGLSTVYNRVRQRLFGFTSG